MKVISWFLHHCTHFFILNLFLTIVSLPILVAWGLPLSWLSPLGNLLFGPFLSLFLLTSTISFACELLGLPHALFDYLLEWNSSLWSLIMQLAPQNSFIACSFHALYPLCGIALIALCILPFLPTIRMRLSGLSVLFVCTLITLHATQPTHVETTLACHKKELRLIRSENTTVLIDDGACSERANPASWAQYHALPDIIRTTGSMTIDHLILSRPTIRALEAATAFMQHGIVRHIYYPTIKGEMSGSHRAVFRKWYAIAKANGITLHRITRKTVLEVGTKRLSIVPDEKITYREIEFHMIKLFDT